MNSSQLSSPKSDIVLISAAFGESVKKPHMRFFLKSAKDCGVDVLIVGDLVPAFPLPANVKHFQISWHDMWARVKNRVSECKIDPEERATVSGYKVCWPLTQPQPLRVQLTAELQMVTSSGARAGDRPEASLRRPLRR
eukprot:1352051-Rhodomonas_salina.3